MEQYQLSDQGYESFPEQSIFSEDLLSWPDQVSYKVICRDKTLHVQHSGKDRHTIWRLYRQSDQLKLEWLDTKQLQVTELLAAIEAAFTYYPYEKTIHLSA